MEAFEPVLSVAAALFGSCEDVFEVVADGRPSWSQRCLVELKLRVEVGHLREIGACRRAGLEYARSTCIDRELRRRLEDIVLFGWLVVSD